MFFFRHGYVTLVFLYNFSTECSRFQLSCDYEHVINGASSITSDVVELCTILLLFFMLYLLVAFSKPSCILLAPLGSRFCLTLLRSGFLGCAYPSGGVDGVSVLGCAALLGLSSEGGKFVAVNTN